MRHVLTYDAHNIRLDQYVSSAIPDMSRNRLSSLIVSGAVTVDGKSVKPSFKPHYGATIELEIPETVMSDIRAENIPLEIAYEDDDLLVVNKPQGMVVHPAPGHYSGTLVNALMFHFNERLSDIYGSSRPGIIHRIDKDTSGLLIVVKNNEMHTKMSRLISNHDVIRSYRCCVHGIIDTLKGTIDAPIGRSDSDRKKMTVKGSGKLAVTHFEVVKRFAKATDLSVVLETGRTHQIRAHMAFIGHPAIGDPVYSGRRTSYGLVGQALHSKSIRFTHPGSGKEIFVESELPDYYKKLLDTLNADAYTE
ncbi:MAG: RluA family pseudouridine synthase [Clostridiaceae bacterium]|nr:RluA family pseudouridine synthase [Clostridiaceae bacterium]